MVRCPRNYIALVSKNPVLAERAGLSLHILCLLILRLSSSVHNVMTNQAFTRLLPTTQHQKLTMNPPLFYL